VHPAVPALQQWQISHPTLCLCPNLLSADRPALIGGPKAYPWEASVDTPRLPPFKQDCVRKIRDERLHRGQGADASRRPVSGQGESFACIMSDGSARKWNAFGPKVDSPK